MVTTVTARSGRDLQQIRARALNVEAIAKVVGRILESQSQRTFLEQRLGEHEWPERYPNQEDPFVNIAALVNWTNEGNQIQSRFFDRRPALMGTNALSGSISARYEANFVEVGSALGYASNHQWGLPSTQPITSQAKSTIAKFIGEESDGSGGWVKAKRMGPRQKEQREKYWFKLFPLLSMNELTTTPVARPFLGITPQNEADIAEDVEYYLATGDL